MAGLELRGRVGDDRRHAARRARARPRRPPAHVGGARPPGRRRGPRPARRRAPRSRTRSRSTSTTATSTSSRCSPCFKAGLVPVNTNYRYTDDELVYLWDNADAVAVCSTAPSPSASRRSATGCPTCGSGSGSTTAPGPARRGPRPTRPRPTGRRRARRTVAAVGPVRRRHLHALHGRHDGHAQGRHVAPARPLPAPERVDHARPRRARPRRGAQPAHAARPHHAARVPADARHGRVLVVRHPRAWAARSSRSPTVASTPPSCSTPSSARA